MSVELTSYMSQYASLTAEITSNISKIGRLTSELSENRDAEEAEEQEEKFKNTVSQVNKSFEDAEELFEQIKACFFNLMNRNLPIYGVPAKLKDYATSKKDTKAGQERLPPI